MRPSKEAHIVGYGAYVPIYSIRDKEIARVWGRSSPVPVEQKSVIGPDEDSITLAVQAAKYALMRANLDGSDIGVIFTGTESKPYAVKPISTVVAEAIGATPNVVAADLEFACKAATTALQALIGMVSSDMVKYGMVIGVDTAQGRPGDELEYTAGCGSAALILGRESRDAIARIEASSSYVTDTPDFWRREGQIFPNHAFRFTGEPAYFKHIIRAAKALLEELGLRPTDYDYIVLHQPNVKYPIKVAKLLGFPKEKVLPGLLSPVIGNSYAAASLIGLCKVFDQASPGQRVLLVSFGSGAGSDAFSIVMEEGIKERRDRAPKLEEILKVRRQLDYALYAKYRGLIRD
ncbi:MAG: hydroxymethylglutaryl-CoA synthase [Thermofilum sp. ex4484_15]|nr:MAG: hydroxymethylglutaryl-CoA synthase [Thermofilum sp. ex4484_15]